MRPEDDSGEGHKKAKEVGMTEEPGEEQMRPEISGGGYRKTDEEKKDGRGKRSTHESGGSHKRLEKEEECRRKRKSGHHSALHM